MNSNKSRDHSRQVEAELTARERSLGSELAARQLELTEGRTALAEVRLVAATKHEELTTALAEVRLVAATKHEELTTALAQSVVYARRLEAELARARSESEELQAQLSAFLCSSSWRITRPLRYAFGRYPVISRTVLRAANLICWITLQLPNRIAARRKGAEVSGTSIPSSLNSPQPEPAPPQLESDFLQPSEPHALHLDRELRPLEPKRSQPPPGSEQEAKELFAAQARKELDDFLASSERLVFRVFESPDISVIVILRNQAHLTLRCVRALFAERSLSKELVLFDNASDDETTELLSRIDGAQVLRNATNDGFLIGCNKAVAATRGRVVLLLNSDAFVRVDTIKAALEVLDANSNVGAVGGRLILPSGLLQEAGSILWSDASTLGYSRGLKPEAGEAMFRRDVDYCSAAFLMTPRLLWDRLGGFDGLFRPAYYEEADYCMRLHSLGYRVIYEPRAAVDHYEFGSEKRQGDAVSILKQNRKRFRTRHSNALRHDHLPPSQANILVARQRRRFQSGRALVIDDELPLRDLGSGYPRMRNLLVEANSLGWFLTFFPLHRSAVDWEIARTEIPWEIEIVSDRGAPQVSTFLEERRSYYDVIIIRRPDNMALVRDVCRDRPHVLEGCRLIYDAEELFCTREIIRAAVEELPAPDVEALISADVGLAEGADAIICVTQSEADNFRSRTQTPVHVLGHSIKISDDAPGFTGRADFLFSGRLLEREAPDWRGLLWFIRECWPLVRQTLPDATLWVVGLEHPNRTELDAAGVRFCGPVVDVRPFYDMARVFLAPIRFAAGIPIKILEATAAGLPTAGTRLMARQLAWTPGVETIAEDDPGALSSALISLHEHEGLWNRMRAAARERLKEHSAMAFRDELRIVLYGEPPSSSVIANPIILKHK